LLAIEKSGREPRQALIFEILFRFLEHF